MLLKDLKGTYDAIYSLGLNCMPSMQLQRLNLRNHAGVLDWMISNELTGVIRLLENRFKNFLDFTHLEIEHLNVPNPPNLYVKDKKYQIISAHDFPINVNKSLKNLASYPAVKVKYDRRIKRFLEKLETSQHLLFIRIGGTPSEAFELDRVLNSLIKHNYKILMLQPSSVVNLTYNSYAVTHQTICSLQIPINQIKTGANCYPVWDYLLKDIKLVT